MPPSARRPPPKPVAALEHAGVLYICPRFASSVHAVRASDPAYDSWRAAHAAWKALPPVKKVKPFPGVGYDYFPAPPTPEASYVDIAPGTLLHTYEFTWNQEMAATLPKNLEFDGFFATHLSVDETTNELVIENEARQTLRRPLVPLS
jgi:hypothetical protein